MYRYTFETEPQGCGKKGVRTAFAVHGFEKPAGKWVRAEELVPQTIFIQSP
jgi:hypothetical protein